MKIDEDILEKFSDFTIQVMAVFALIGFWVFMIYMVLALIGYTTSHVDEIIISDNPTINLYDERGE